MADVRLSDRDGQFGMELPEPTENRQRWAQAVDRMAMALSEAGYPTKVERFFVSKPSRENELVFAKFPPPDVMLRAGRLCGIEDLIQLALDGVDAQGWPGACSDCRGRR
jgi:hypothetical protein